MDIRLEKEKQNIAQRYPKVGKEFGLEQPQRYLKVGKEFFGSEQP